ncbi:MAG: carbohydrate-binding domain-containing protein [Leucobacter sp.]
MKKRLPYITTSLAAAAALSTALLVGCSGASAATDGTGQALQMQAGETLDSDLAPDAVMAENADYTTVNLDEWSESDAVDVTLTGSSAKSDSSSVAVDGSTVTITEAGVYRLSGSLAGGVVIAAPDDALVVLILDGAEIDNAAGAAIEVQTADDVAVHLADGSENSLSDASSYADDASANAALYSDADLTISGQGSLTVTGNGNDGITSKDDLVILGGTITVTAADDALRGKDALVVEGGALDLTATGGDGMKSDGDDDEASADIDWTQGYIYVSGGSIDITAGDDGLQAFTDTVVVGGSVVASVVDDGVKGEVIVSIGESADAGAEAPNVTVSASTEGIEAANIGISAGTIDVTASDDGINASGNAELQARIVGTEFTGVADREADTGERLEISGGTVTIVAGFDGLDSNGSLTISGGTVTITSAANGGDGPIDANGTVAVADGIVTANGAAWDESMATGMGGGMPGGQGGGQGQMPGGEMPGGGQPPQGGMPGGQASEG